MDWDIQDLLSRYSNLRDLRPDDVMNALKGMSRPEQQPAQPPVQSPAQTQEQPSGTDMINRTMERAIPQLQQQSPRPVPNPLEVDMQRSIVGAKGNYAAADTDAKRMAAQQQAQLLRDIANSVGMDMSGYGADDTLQDATKRLASREAQDIIEGLQGRYAKTTDQYYQDTYMEGIMRGYSPRQARRLAGTRAQQYQANRVAYLDGLFNSYGRDGRVVTAVGNQILGAMAQENPLLAGFYLQIYPNQQDAYKRDNQLEDFALTQNNALARMAQQYLYNEQFAQNEHGRREQSRDKDVARDTAKYGARTAIDFANTRNLQGLKEEAEERAYRKGQARANEWADYLGFTGDEKKYFVAAINGIKLPTKQGGKIDSESLKNLKTYHDMLGSREQQILSELKKEDGTLAADDGERAKRLTTQLESIRQQRQELENMYGEVLGISGAGYEDFSDTDESKNIANIARILQIGAQSGENEEQQFQAVRKWVPQDRTDHYVRGLIKKARGG